MTSWTSPRFATSARYRGWSSIAVSVAPAFFRSSIVSNSGEMPTGQGGPSSPSGSSSPTSLSRRRTSSTLRAEQPGFLEKYRPLQHVADPLAHDDLVVRDRARAEQRDLSGGLLDHVE